LLLHEFLSLPPQNFGRQLPDDFAHKFVFNVHHFSTHLFLKQHEIIFRSRPKILSPKNTKIFGVLSKINFSVITGKTRLHDRVAFFTQLNSIRTRSPSPPNEIIAPIDPLEIKEELGPFRRSGSVRDLARKFGSNSSLNSNSNNSNFSRNVTHRRSWHVSESKKPIIKSSTISISSPKTPIIKTQTASTVSSAKTGDFLRNIENEKDQKEISLAPPAMPKIRKSMKLTELENLLKNSEKKVDAKIRIRRKSSFGKAESQVCMGWQ
jgi:hypothetical protein